MKFRELTGCCKRMAGFGYGELAVTGTISTCRYTEGHAERYAQASGVEELKYTVIYERSANGYGAYVPDLPGLGVVAPTLEETRRLILEGIPAHLRAMREHGEAIPEPTSYAEDVDVAALA